MDTNKNSYTIIYATVLVVVVAAILAFVAISLKDKQQKNIDIEKQMSLLKAVGLAQDANTVADKDTYIEKEFSKYITGSLTVNNAGEISDLVESDNGANSIVNSAAFKINLKEQYDIMRQANASSNGEKGAIKLPIFICTLDSGEQLYIVSCYGAGLWGPIWGYIAIKSDFNTVYGASFDHKGETPGLGAEIATVKFQDQFKGKEFFDNGNFTSVSIVKGGAEPGNMHEVDAISGGTITSKSLDATIKNWMEHYMPYIKAQQEKAQTPVTIPANDSIPVAQDSTTMVTIAK